MPISGSKAAKSDKAAGSGAATTERTTFRPPWVKEGPKPIPMPSAEAPWTKRNSGTTAINNNANGTTQKEVKLQSREIKVPIVTQRKTSIPEPTVLLKPKPKEIKVVVPEDNYETSSSEYEEVTDSEGEEEETSEEEESEKEIEPKLPIQVKLKPVEKPPTKIEKSPSVDKAGKFVRPVLKKVAKIDEIVKPKSTPPPTIPEKKVLRTVDKPAGFKEPPIVEQKDVLRPPLRKSDSTTQKGPQLPPPPPPPNMVPPPPPPPGLAAPAELAKKIVSEKQKQFLEKLKSRPRRRPDWSDMMKEVESGKKLKHVECNDRSRPILKSETITNIKGQFVYETEKANVHNALLHQIQGGIRLKSVKTNDRSKPILQGLRKFRRQMTIEEQIQKSESRAQLGQLNNEEPPAEESADEMDDIDKLRDDLQSTKQMLALELRNKEAQERENKRLLAKIQNLEAELSKSQATPNESGDGEGTGDASPTAATGPVNAALIDSLKAEAEEAQKTSKLLEKKYQDAAEQLDTVKSEVEDQKRTIANLEKKLAQTQGTSSTMASRRQSEAATKESSPEPEIQSSESEEDEDEEKKAARLARRLAREVKVMSNKLVQIKEKQKAAHKERQNIRETMKKNQIVLKEEKKKYKKLQQEVDKMAALMRDEDDDDEDNEEGETKPEANETANDVDGDDDETETEDSESEAEESESESEPEDAPDDKKKNNYEPRIKRHEGRLAALKKGNLLRQTNLDRIIDEINKIRDESVTLQHDLDSVLSELG